LIFVANPADTVQFGRSDDLQKEWQECRTAIGRLDSTLVDLRKYGFGLASGLLTAGGVLGGIANILPKPNSTSTTTVPSGTSMFTVSPSVVAGIVAVTVLLVFVLFVVDRYYTMIQWGAINRARALERAISLGMTQEISRWAGWRKPTVPILGKELSLWRWVAIVQYGGFVVVAFALGTAVTGGWSWAVVIPCGLSLVMIGLVFWIADHEYGALATGPAFARGVSLQTVAIAAAVTVKPGTNDYRITPPSTFPANTRALAVVMPLTPDLAAVGCHVGEDLALMVGLSNPTMNDITLAAGDIQVITYVASP
jgi:hypothetical protein